MRRVKILGTGKYLPTNRLTAAQMAQRLGKDENWVAEKSGIKVRHFVEQETASFMAAAAARQAMQAAGVGIEDIDCIVCSSGTPEQSIPCTAALVQKQLGAEESGKPGFDVNSSCLSFITALDLISYMIDSDRYNRVLVVSSEICAGVNWDDPETSMLFGDGAAAAVLGKTPKDESSAFLSARMETYSKGVHLSVCLAGGNKHRPEEYAIETDRLYFYMDGKAIYKMASQVMPDFVEKMLAPTQLRLEQLDMVIPHQASLSALTLMRHRLNVPESKWMNIIATHGNTIAASVPMTLHEAIAQGKMQRGNHVMLLGTAAGLSIGGIVLRY
jgi:3-oxoacyl-[acyl-carrier-protein] synthase III